MRYDAIIHSGIIESKATQRVAVRQTTVRQTTVARLALETDTTTLIFTRRCSCRYDGSAIVSMRVFGRSVVQPSFHAEKMCTRRRVEYLIPLRILVRTAQPGTLSCPAAALCCNAVVPTC